MEENPRENPLLLSVAFGEWIPFQWLHHRPFPVSERPDVLLAGPFDLLGFVLPSPRHLQRKDLPLDQRNLLDGVVADLLPGDQIQRLQQRRRPRPPQLVLLLHPDSFDAAFPFLGLASNFRERRILRP